MARHRKYENPEDRSTGEHVRTAEMATVSIRCMDREVWKQFRDLCYHLDMQSPDVFALILSSYLKGMEDGEDSSQ